MFEKIKPVTRYFLRTFVPLFFGLFVFWLIFRKLEFKQIMLIVRKDVNYWIIALSLPFGLFANIIRAYRWRLLIHPLGYRPKISNLIYAFLKLRRELGFSATGGSLAMHDGEPLRENTFFRSGRNHDYRPVIRLGSDKYNRGNSILLKCSLFYQILCSKFGYVQLFV